MICRHPCVVVTRMFNEQKVVNFNNAFLTYTQYIWRQKSYQLFLWSQYDSSTIVYLFVSLPDVSHLCRNEWFVEWIKDIALREKTQKIIHLVLYYYNMIHLRFIAHIRLAKWKENFFSYFFSKYLPIPHTREEV